VLAADIRPDQSQVALGGPSRIVKIWSTKTGELLHKIKKHTDWVTAIAFSPNGQMLATADRNGGISIWDPDSAQELFTLAGHKSAVTALSWRGDSKLLASSSEDGTVKLWEMDEGKQFKSWTPHGTGALSVSYAHDGNLVTCGRDNSITLWDGTGKKVRDLEKFCNLPLRSVFNFDGTRVFASDFDGQMAAWSVKDGKRIAKLDANPLPTAFKLAAATKVRQ
jgi:WD40 repeat protein